MIDKTSPKTPPAHDSTDKKKLPDPREKNFYHINKWYSISISPSNRYQYYRSVDRFSKFKNMIYEYFITYDSLHVIELSEPRGIIHSDSSGPRLHTHGIIRFRYKSELYKFMMYTMPSLLDIGRLEIDTIDDMKYWLKYMKKQKIIPSNIKVITNNADIDSMFKKLAQ